MKLSDKCTEKILIHYGFSKYGNDFVYKVTLHKYKRIPIIELIITVDLREKHFNYEVIDLCNQTIYTPFYNKEYSHNNLVLEKVKKRIKSEFIEMQKFGILKKDFKHKYKRKGVYHGKGKR